MRDLVGQKTFVTSDAHIGQATLYAGGQELFGQPGKRWCFAPAEKVRRDGEIDLIDETALE